MPNESAQTLNCTRCNGTGEYHGTRRDGTSYIGRCFTCQGGPRVAYGRGRWSRRAAPVPVFVAPQAPAAVSTDTPRMAANWETFAGAFPAEALWLVNNASAGVDFARSLMQGCKRYGGLTPRQLAAVRRNLQTADAPGIVLPADVGPAVDARDAVGFTAAQRAELDTALANAHVDGLTLTAPAQILSPRPVTPPAPAPITIDMDRVRVAMDAAAASGLRKVRLTLGNVEFKLSGPRFRGGQGMILCYYRTPLQADASMTHAYCGYVDRENRFHIANAFRYSNQNLPAGALDAFRSAAADPQAAARTHGADTGYCSCCRRLLTDPPSVMAGIGPVCITRFGWSF